MSTKDSACLRSDDAKRKSTRVKLFLIPILLLLPIVAILVTIGVSSGINHASAAVYGYSQSYYFPLYDNMSTGITSDTILVSNLGNADTTVQISIGGNVVQTETVAPDTEVDWQASTPTKDGIVQVTSVDGQPLLVSQRTIYDGNVCNETYAVAANDLDSNYYFGWYDDSTLGLSSSIEIGNSGSQTASVSVYIAGQLKGSYSVSPQSTATEQFPGMKAGPVQIISNNGQPIVAGERAIWRNSLDEILGLSGGSLASDYSWPWYENTNGTTSWVLISSASANEYLYYEIDGAGANVLSSGLVLPGQIIAPSFTGLNNGPVRVRGWRDSAHTIPASFIASMRILRNNGTVFEEIQGIPSSTLNSNYYLSKQNEANSLFSTRLTIANAGGQSSTTDVYIGNNQIPALTTSIPSNSAMKPNIPQGISGGPVRIVSREGQPIIASQDFTYVPPPNPAIKYYFPWYDSKPEHGMGGNWILVCNEGSSQAAVDVYIGGKPKGSYIVNPGQEITPHYPNTMDGPVEVISKNGQPLLTSQRVIFGRTFNEVIGVRASDLDTSYYFPWYDSKVEHGMGGNWILVGNEGSTAAHVEIYVGGAKMHDPANPNNDYFTVQPGSEITPTFPGLMAGPVKVISTNGQPLICSQRVIYKSSFNEVMGQAASKLESKYHFTWYDSKTADQMGGDWILTSNADPSNEADIQICFSGHCGPISSNGSPGYVPLAVNQYFNLALRQIMVPNIDVQCINSRPIFTSQRVIYKDSFSEAMGYPDSKLTTSYNFTWYDSLSPGIATWLLAINKGSSGTEIQICVHGQCTVIKDQNKNPLSVPPGYTLVLPPIPLRDGPVQISSLNGQNLMASERVTYLDGFHEVQGTPASAFGAITTFQASAPNSFSTTPSRSNGIDEMRGMLIPSGNVSQDEIENLFKAGSGSPGGGNQ